MYFAYMGIHAALNDLFWMGPMACREAEAGAKKI